MDRRTFLKAIIPASTAIAWSWRANAGAGLAITALAPRLYLITGGGGNVTLFDSTEGALLVDGGSPERSRKVLELMRSTTGAKSVHTLFNTHWHWDQTGSNRTLGPAGTRIIAHENTRLWLGTTVNSKWQHRTYGPLPKPARPTKTFYKTGSLAFGGEQIDYGYLPQAHTDGDIYVFFRRANVLVASDVVSIGAYPIIDYSTNGWIGGMTTATQTLLELANAETKIVPGLGPAGKRTDVEAEHEMLGTLKLRLSKLLTQGMSAKDMLDAGATKDYDAKWGDPTLFVSNVWPGLVQRARELGVAIV